MRRHKGWLYRFIRRYVTDRDDAYDVLQESFVSAWGALSPLRPGKAFRGLAAPHRPQQMPRPRPAKRRQADSTPPVWIGRGRRPPRIMRCLPPIQARAPTRPLLRLETAIAPVAPQFERAAGADHAGGACRIRKRANCSASMPRRSKRGSTGPSANSRPCWTPRIFSKSSQRRVRQISKATIHSPRGYAAAGRPVGPGHGECGVAEAARPQAM